MLQKLSTRKRDTKTGKQQEKVLGTGDAAHGLSVVLIVVVRPGVDVRTIEVQIVRVVVTVRGRGPIVPVRATIVGRARVPVPGIDEKRLSRNSLRFSASLGGENLPS